MEPVFELQIAWPNYAPVERDFPYSYTFEPETVENLYSNMYTQSRQIKLCICIVWLIFTVCMEKSWFLGYL